MLTGSFRFPEMISMFCCPQGLALDLTQRVLGKLLKRHNSRIINTKGDWGEPTSPLRGRIPEDLGCRGPPKIKFLTKPFSRPTQKPAKL